MFNLAVERGYLDRSPVRVKQEREESGQPFFGTVEKVEEIASLCPGGLAAVVRVAARTGGRQEEILGLPWTDVDFEGGRIWFRRTKSKKARSVPMSARVRAILTELRDPEADYVFRDAEGRRLDAAWVRRVFRKAVKGAKAYRREKTDDGAFRWVYFRFHDLRHTYASWLVAEGASLRLIQELLGHADIRTTMRYAHLGPNASGAAVAILDRLDGMSAQVPAPAQVPAQPAAVPGAAS